MEIVTQKVGEVLEVKAKGRFDNYWTEHLHANLDEFIRGGAHVIRLNLSEIVFLSSAGVGMLVVIHRQLKEIGGALVITSPSNRVKQVLDLCGLTPVLLSTEAPVAVETRKTEVRRFSTPVASFEVMDCGKGDQLVLELIGDPEPLHSCSFAEKNCQIVKFPHSTFGLGLGAFGHSFEDSQSRFGEFLAVGGAAAYLPTDGTNVPDFMISSGDLVPEINVLYGIRCHGGFSRLLRFEAATPDSPIPLSHVVGTALEECGAPAAGMVMVAESAGLVGAALRRSPAMAPAAGGSPFRYPEVRTWLSFSTERLYSRSLALISGVAAREPAGRMAPLLRDLGDGTAGHFHAAAFSYRPLKKGELDLKTTVSTLFETETLQGVLHLLTDNRQAGPQQSEFLRGACWIGTVQEKK